MKPIILALYLLVSINTFCSELPRTISISEDMQLIQLSEHFYLHLTYTTADFGRFSSNGLLVIKNGKALLIDSPTTNEETEKMALYLKDSLKVSLTNFIGCHYHYDCVGGMEYLKGQKVHTLLNELTNEKCKELNLPLSEHTFQYEHQFTFEGIEVDCRFLGGGHTFDNIVVYFPTQKILFGGCLVKNTSSRNMGNVADAVPEEWASTVKKVMDSFPEVEMVIPGHGQSGGKELLTFTIELANRFFN